MKKFKYIILSIFLIFMMISLCSCRYINNTWIYFFDDKKTFVGKDEDFSYITTDPDSDEVQILSVTAKGLGKKSITIPETCEIDGKTYRITYINGIEDWNSVEKIYVNNTHASLSDFDNTRLLRDLYIGKNVSFDEDVAPNGYFLRDCQAENIYFEDSNVKTRLQGYVYAGTEFYNIYIMDESSGEYELYSAAQYEKDHTMRNIRLGMDIGACLLAAMTIALLALSLNGDGALFYKKGEKHDFEITAKRNSLITLTAFLIAFAVIKIIGIEYSLWFYGINLLLPFGFLLLCPAFFKDSKMKLAIMGVLVSLAYVIAKYYVFGQSEVRPAFVITMILVVIICGIVYAFYSCANKFFCFISPFVWALLTPSVALVDSGLSAITGALSSEIGMIIALVMIAFAFYIIFGGGYRIIAIFIR